jgi:hypothetical protein
MSSVRERAVGADRAAASFFALRSSADKLECFFTFKVPHRASWLIEHVATGDWRPAAAPKSNAERHALVKQYDECSDHTAQGQRTDLAANSVTLDVPMPDSMTQSIAPPAPLLPLPSAEEHAIPPLPGLPLPLPPHQPMTLSTPSKPSVAVPPTSSPTAPTPAPPAGLLTVFSPSLVLAPQLVPQPAPPPASCLTSQFSHPVAHRVAPTGTQLLGALQITRSLLQHTTIDPVGFFVRVSMGRREYAVAQVVTRASEQLVVRTSSLQTCTVKCALASVKHDVLTGGT